MAKRPPKAQKVKNQLDELVTVTFTNDMEQAKEYETLLKGNDIPVVIKELNDESSGTENIAVMVPEDFLDEAHVVIESQDAYDDFYDYAAEADEEGIDFGDDLFDEDGIELN